MAQQNVRRLHDDPAFRNLRPSLIYEFFAVYSRFEYALKKSPRYLAGWDGQDYPKADWSQFARDTQNDYLDAVGQIGSDFERAVQYVLRDNPPKLETVVGTGTQRRIEFVPNKIPNAPTDWGKVIKYIERARNNLFHGGKYYPAPYDPTRDEKLLTHCVTILKTCIRWRPALERYFRERA